MYSDTVSVDRIIPIPDGQILQNSRQDGPKARTVTIRPPSFSACACGLCLFIEAPVDRDGGDDHIFRLSARERPLHVSPVARAKPSTLQTTCHLPGEL